MTPDTELADLAIGLIAQARLSEPSQSQALAGQVVVLQHDCVAGGSGAETFTAGALDLPFPDAASATTHARRAPSTALSSPTKDKALCQRGGMGR